MWVIIVSGYGPFLFDGTEEEAEEMRRHKAKWEQGVAQKRKATEQEIDLNRVVLTEKEKQFFHFG